MGWNKWVLQCLNPILKKHCNHIVSAAKDISFNLDNGMQLLITFGWTPP